MAKGVGSRGGWAIGIVFMVCCVTSQDLKGDSRSLADLAGKIDDWLENLHETTSATSVLRRDYNGDYNVEIERVRTEPMVQEMARDVNHLLSDKRKALQKIVQHLEDATANYQWKDELDLNTSHPLLMKYLDPSNDSHEMQMDERLGVPVKYNISGIHVPLEVYEGWLWPNIREHREQDPEILNGLRWSATVDRVFRDNFDADQTLMWQYFGAQTGFMRVYPATTWYVPPNLIDLYDARLRPWYVQGSVPPKDMIILMDRSGSVHGQTFTIMKWAVKTLIDTLGENDFVNVAAFNDTTEWVNNCTYCKANGTEEENEGCHQNLVQASTSNKKLLFRAIDELEDGGIASYSNALEFALKAFKEYSQTKARGEGAQCHKTIMLFSDGGTEWPEEIFKKYKADEDTKDVRVFTYAVGPHPIPTAVLKQMACSTGGQYSVITTRSSVRTKIQDYLQVLARPQALPIAESMITFYQERVTEELTVSLTRPVYNMSDYANTSDLLGVAGIDVPIQSLKNLSPFEALGPNGYTFIINHNGFIVMHPRLSPQLSYLLGPPHVDLLDVEEETNETVFIRKRMANETAGSESVLGKIRIDDSHSVVYSTIQYTWTPITDTTYSLGIVNLRRSYHMIVHNQSGFSVAEQFNTTDTVIAPWPYCRGRQASDSATRVKDFIRDISERRGMCKDLDKNDLAQGLLWSQSWTQELLKQWKKDRWSKEDLIGRVIFTRFGLTRFYPESQRPGALRWQDPWYNPALRRGELSSRIAIIPHALGAFLSAPVKVAKNYEVMAGVVGVNLTASYLHSEFKTMLLRTDWDKNYLLLLVDDGGLIVTSNEEELHGVTLQGMFLGDLNIPLMEHLYNASIYNMEKRVNTQAICKESKTKGTSAGPRSFLIPNPLKLVAGFLIEILSWADYLRYMIFSCVVALMSPSVEAWSEWGMTQIGGQESCVMSQAIYYFGENTRHSAVMHCSNHTAKFWVRRLVKANAILVAIETKPEECGVYSSLPNITPERVTTVKPCAYQARFRRRPSSCLMGNSTDYCSKSSHPAAASFGTVLSVLLVCKIMGSIY
ncbi:voltage-dependent calcium channel subunit alpha-2/delta-1 isoform X2 [Penaeus vannamei]|uniref:voltage-dependent calcium channel subunit alpha-2/delta-1 isoform X2 n=1 Tax=Penaeus vannamei TaxID=6689 RepID=UPI00387F643A